MRDIATAQLSGNLTQDVELRSLPSGADVARLRVAFTTRWRQGEEWVDKTNYVTVDVFGGQARACAQYLAKGSRVFVDGELDWSEWTAQDGKPRQAVSLKARHVLFEGPRNHTNATTNTDPVQPAPHATQPAAHTATPAATAATAATATADDLPF